jgi:uncharacterized RDD family membrane protein YckC
MSEEQVPRIPEDAKTETGGDQGVAPPPPPEIPAPPAAERPGAQPAKADLGKRFVAALIDGILAGVVGVIPVVGGLIGAAYMLVRDGLDLDFMDGRSLGKKVMKLRPVRLDGAAMDIATSVKRNIPFAIGPAIMIIPILGWILGPVVALVIGLVEAVLVLTDEQGRRMGDKLAETMVIETED